MQARGESKVLASPQITTLDNHSAESNITTTVYYEGSVSNMGNQNSSRYGNQNSNINNNDIIEALTTNKEAFCPNKICENFHNINIVMRAPRVDTYLYDEILSSPNILAKNDCAQ